MSRIVNLMKKIKEKIAIVYNYFVCYPIITKKFDFCVMSDKETVDNIINNKLSISRFGDGEYKIIRGEGIGFQKFNDELSKRLKEVLNSNDVGHMNCIPLSFLETKGLVWRAAAYCRSFTVSHYSEYKKITPPKRTYGSAGFTRFYADFKNKRSRIMEGKINRIRSIWENKDIYLIEGEFTRCGVGNDILDNAKSVHRIICPATDAYNVYDAILQSVKENVSTENTIILCLLGPTATVMAYDLFKNGYWALDMGHIDIEYEWFKRGVAWKAPIEGKAVNERGGNQCLEPITSDEYENQIIKKIGIE